MLKRTALLCLILCMGASSAWAGKIILKNGDQLTGHIDDSVEETVLIITDIFGPLKVSRDHVASILTDEQAAAQAQSPQPPPAEPVQPQPEAVVLVPKSWQHNLAAGYSTSNGNTKTSSANVSLDSHYKKGIDEWNIKSLLEYASDKGRMTTQKFYSRAGSDSRFREGSKWFNRRSVELNHDKFANIDYRILPAIGIGYWFWEGERSKAEFDLGIGYEYTNYNTTDTKSTGNFSLIPHFYIDKTLIGKSKISQDLTMYPSLESFADFRMRSETAFVNPVSDRLSFKLSFIDEYNSTPPAGAKKNDTTFLSSIQFSF